MYYRRCWTWLTEVMAKNCLGCAVPLGANRTDEHVIALWLLKELGLKEEELRQIVANSHTGDMGEPREPHPMQSFLQGSICARCNSGWLSQLESDAQAVLPALLNGTRIPTSLSDSECLIVSRWMLKTAVVLSHAAPLKKPLPPEHLQFLRNNLTDLPPQVGVFATFTVPTREFGSRQRNHWVNGSLSETPALLAEMRAGAYKLSIQLRRLLLMAAYLPRVSSQFLLAAGLHIPLWPMLPIFPCYKADLTFEPPYDSIKVLAIFNDSLGALHVAE
jgi:hypothetical protein